MYASSAAVEMVIQACDIIHENGGQVYLDGKTPPGPTGLVIDHRL